MRFLTIFEMTDDMFEMIKACHFEGETAEKSI